MQTQAVETKVSSTPEGILKMVRFAENIQREEIKASLAWMDSRQGKRDWTFSKLIRKSRESYPTCEFIIRRSNLVGYFEFTIKISPNEEKGSLEAIITEYSNELMSLGCILLWNYRTKDDS